MFRYNDTNIIKAINEWKNKTTPNCAFNSDFSKSLLVAVEMAPEIGNHEYKGPGKREPWPYATSIGKVQVDHALI